MDKLSGPRAAGVIRLEARESLSSDATPLGCVGKFMAAERLVVCEKSFARGCDCGDFGRCGLRITTTLRCGPEHRRQSGVRYVHRNTWIHAEAWSEAMCLLHIIVIVRCRWRVRAFSVLEAHAKAVNALKKNVEKCMATRLAAR